MTSKEALETIKEIELDEYKGYKTVDYLYKEEIEILEQALEKAQKQEKLLELYKKLSSLIVGTPKFVGSEKLHYVCRYSDDDKYTVILKQIKELEND